jgi:Flp pilus assembly pilin Flp
MSNHIQNTARPTFLARVRSSLVQLGRDRRGAELVEVLVVIAIFALGGVAAMQALGGKVTTASDQLGDKVVTAVGQ